MFRGQTLASQSALNGSALQRLILLLAASLLHCSIVLQPGCSFRRFSAVQTYLKTRSPTDSSTPGGNISAIIASCVLETAAPLMLLFREFHEGITCFIALNVKLWQLLFNKLEWFLTYFWRQHWIKSLIGLVFFRLSVSACLVSSSPALVIIISSTSHCQNVTGIILQRGVWFKLLYSVFLGSIPEFEAINGTGLFKNNQRRKIKLLMMLKEYKLTHYQLGSPPASAQLRVRLINVSFNTLALTSSTSW